MEIKEILLEKPWEEFLTRQPHTTFLQSWAWGEFQDKLGLSHHRFGIYQGGPASPVSSQGGALVGICQALVGRRKLGSFVYVPRGPILNAFESGQARLDSVSARQAQTVLEYLKDFAGREKVDYLRVEPPWAVQSQRELQPSVSEDSPNGARDEPLAQSEARLGRRQGWEVSPELGEFLHEVGYRKAQAPTSQAGGVTLLLDLALSEEELLAQMRKTTRYLLRNAVGLGIEVHRSADPRKMEEFHRLMSVTYRRQRFVPHSRRYLQVEFEALAPRGMAELVWAKYQGNILSAAIIFSYGDTVSYVHGASVHTSVPASYFLLWETIKEAKKDGYRYFDFWGIAPNDDPRHPWYGYSLFKKGFGGYRVDYAGTWDYPLTPRYWAVFGAEKLRQLIRRY